MRENNKKENNMFIANEANEKTITKVFTFLYDIHKVVSKEAFIVCYTEGMKEIFRVCGSDYWNSRRMNHTSHRFLCDKEVVKDAYFPEEYDKEVEVINTFKKYYSI